MVAKVKKGEPLYGTSQLTEYMQGVASRQSRYAGTWIHVMPWFNFVNHNQVSGQLLRVANAPLASEQNKDSLTHFFCSTVSTRKSTTSKLNGNSPPEIRAWPLAGWLLACRTASVVMLFIQPFSFSTIFPTIYPAVLWRENKILRPRQKCNGRSSATL